MNKFVYVFFIFFIFSCNSDKRQKLDSEAVQSQWVEFKVKDSIPVSLKKRLAAYFKTDFELANSNERFNATDVLIDSLPQRQLQYLGRNGNLWRLSYIQGGFAKYYVLVEGKVLNDSVLNFRIGKSELPLYSNDIINTLIDDKTIEFQH